MLGLVCSAHSQSPDLFTDLLMSKLYSIMHLVEPLQSTSGKALPCRKACEQASCDDHGPTVGGAGVGAACQAERLLVRAQQAYMQCGQL
jgi:hypothetical protein